MPQFIPRQRKHKARQRDGERHHVRNSAAPSDTNVSEIVSRPKAEIEQKRLELRKSLFAQQSVVSSKKRKRLDKYIDTKLKKQENLELIQKLSSDRADTALLKSSKSLGQGKESRRATLEKALRKTQAGINQEENHGILFDTREIDSSSSVDSDASSQIEDLPKVTEKLAAPVIIPGSGLKRPLETGEDGNPVIRKRVRSGLKLSEPSVQEEVSWDGFDSDSVAGRDSEVSSVESRSIGSQTDTETEDEEQSSGDSYISDDENLIFAAFSDAVDERLRKKKDRSSAFKSWATDQVNEALGFTPTPNLTLDQAQPQIKHMLSKVPRPLEQDPLPPELEIRSRDPHRKAFSVSVQRPSIIQEARLGLPIVAEEQKIMEAIHNYPAVVIWGATGSGKTTQVPQFLYEAGYGSPDSPTPGLIGVTQPRRVAAVSMAKRVGDELGSTAGKVSYQIRFDSTVSDKTAIKFMTDGILIREIAQDFSLKKYSAIIVDEAHERSTNTDILIGMLSRIVDLRMSMSKSHPDTKPLKLIIMSATLRISDFTQNANLFRDGPPPLLQAEGRQYPVTVHFARKTKRDYLEETFLKVSRGHKKLPPGGMLVFLTGQNEITAIAKRLKQSLSNIRSTESGMAVRITASEAPLEVEDVEIGEDGQNYNSISEDDNEDAEDAEAREFDIEDDTVASSGVMILPLFSQLPTKEQLRVFETPPPETRLIVLATNVAETSITIPGIRYVFDCGHVKEKKYDKVTGVQHFEIGWISKASASQRAGRAGRTGPGHCYRLYSSAVYERDFEEYAKPEILRMPVEGVVLQLKSMDLQHVVNFPFPTPPDRQSLMKAEKLLMYLGAIDSLGKITDIGRDLSIYPLSPRFSKMLLIGHQFDCMPYTIALVAALAVPDLFIPENQLDLDSPLHEEGKIYTNADRLADDARDRRKKAYGKAHATLSRHDKHSDALKLLTALCAYAYAPSPSEFCTQMFLRPKALAEASLLRQQLHEIVRLNRPGLLAPYNSKLSEPSEKQLKALRQIVAAGFIDQIAIRADLSPNPPDQPRKPKTAINVPYLTLFPSYEGPPSDDPSTKFAYVHPSSVLVHSASGTLPQYVIYSSLQRSTAKTITGSKIPKVRMHTLTSVGENAIAALAKESPLLEYGKPVGKVISLGGKPERREAWVVPSLVGSVGGMGWPLGVRKVVQVKGRKGEWGVEKVIT
ncbi:MAG: putative ATP-dependent RNA helicase DHR1 [Icmadophila ericetorum]|nr:putative ATP-dependent RNA helicase DHR1 [Icmadophila ericetorum]